MFIIKNREMLSTPPYTLYWLITFIKYLSAPRSLYI
uniref:Uncharacterized protein n=1 Tax=Podoviridae sp. ct8Lf7 TaxID=2827723 RepID=A0A8S5S0I0_9CAUD|nr:MAG TPA: hypothetical protein [Podoviridae sp. ct8Lf7]